MNKELVHKRGALCFSQVVVEEKIKGRLYVGTLFYSFNLSIFKNPVELTMSKGSKGECVSAIESFLETRLLENEITYKPKV